jgi:hypothetical protein
VPILREAAIAAGLIVLVIVGGYAYIMLTDAADKKLEMAQI